MLLASPMSQEILKDLSLQHYRKSTSELQALSATVAYQGPLSVEGQNHVADVTRVVNDFVVLLSALNPSWLLQASTIMDAPQYGESSQSQRNTSSGRILTEGRTGA